MIYKLLIYGTIVDTLAGFMTRTIEAQRAKAPIRISASTAQRGFSSWLPPGPDRELSAWYGPWR
jgi:hypothetical protein